MKNSKKRFFTFVSLAAFLFAMLIGGTNTNVYADDMTPDTPEYSGYTPNDPDEPCADFESTDCGIRIDYDDPVVIS